MFTNTDDSHVDGMQGHLVVDITEIFHMVILGNRFCVALGFSGSYLTIKHVKENRGF